MLTLPSKLLLIGVLASSLNLPYAAASAPDPAGKSSRCLSDNGTDVGRYFDVGRADVIWLNLQGQQPPCLTVTRGNTFIRAHGWIAQLPPGTPVDGGVIETVYPAGYVPAKSAPMKDFLSKITQARYVVSRDGRVVTARTVERRQLLDRAEQGEFGDLFVAPDTGGGVTIHDSAPEWTTLEPFSSRGLSRGGGYQIEIYWTLTHRHCDGFGADPVANCLPAGESLATSTAFEIA